MQDKVKKTCVSCRKSFTTDQKTVGQFGVDLQCMKCVDWQHVDFMNKTGKKLGLSCVKGCRCGFGK